MGRSSRGLRFELQIAHGGLVPDPRELLGLSSGTFHPLGNSPVLAGLWQTGRSRRSRRDRSPPPFPQQSALLMAADAGREDAIKYNIGYWPSLPADAHEIHLVVDFSTPGVIMWKKTLG